jgi:hypothetical protein
MGFSRCAVVIHGLGLRSFLESRRKRAKQTCSPGHLYCRHTSTRGETADYIPITPTSGNLRQSRHCSGRIGDRVPASAPTHSKVKLMADIVPFPLVRRRRLIASMAQRMPPKQREHNIKRTTEALLRYGVDPLAVEEQIKQLRTAVALRIAACGNPWEDRA